MTTFVTRSRSRGAPDWTLQEMMTLASVVAAVEEDCRGTLSSHQKWEIISSHLVALDVPRSAAYCRRKWDSLISDHRAIGDWHLRSGGGSYWCLESGRRTELGLPASFDRELFAVIDNVINAPEDRVGPESPDSDSERLVGEGDRGDEPKGEEEDEDAMMMDSGSKKNKQRRLRTATQKVRELANLLEENSEQIEAILGEQSPENASKTCSMVGFTKPDAMEADFKMKQADLLIKVFGSLNENLDQLNELLGTGVLNGI